MRFEGHTTIVTGAAQGIGLAVVERLFREGGNLVLADIDGEAVERVARELDPAQARAVSVRYDASLLADADALVALAADRFGAVDHLVPAAGIYRDEPFRDMTDLQWQTTLLVNLDGVAGLCRRVLPHMKPGSSIVLITSIAAHAGGSRGHVHYGAAKGALLALGRGMARELGPDIRVNMVSPGLIETAMTRGVIASRGEQIAQATPLARYGTSAEVASVVAFLLSDDASFVNGEAVHVNGGQYMGG